MLTSELFDMVDQYLERVISLHTLEDWLVPRLPLFFKLPYSSVEELVAAIEVGLADISNSTISEEEFRHSLRDSINRQTVYPITFADVTQENFASSAVHSPSHVLIHQFTTAGFTSVAPVQ